MNREQKIAYSLVISMPLAMLLGVMALVVHNLGITSPKPFICAAGAVMAVGVFFCFVFVKKYKGKVISDERDELIKKNAFLAGLGAVYLLVILISYAPIAIAPEAGVPTKWFPALLPTAVLCQAFVQSLAVSIQYGWRNKNE